jgi:hypothetical protein
VKAVKTSTAANKGRQVLHMVAVSETRTYVESK